MFKVKICGIQEKQHLHAAAESGASYVGFVFYQNSRRNVSIQTAKDLTREAPREVLRVALMVNPTNEFICTILNDVTIDMIQLHGNESVERVRCIKNLVNMPVMKAIGVSSKYDLAIIKKYETVVDQILLDAKPPVGSMVPGGLGKKFDWDLLSGFHCKKPWLLAGGLNANNVRVAIKKTAATQLDVSSGVEDKSGRKSRKKIVEFIDTLKGNLDA